MLLPCRHLTLLQPHRCHCRPVPDAMSDTFNVLLVGAGEINFGMARSARASMSSVVLTTYPLVAIQARSKVPGTTYVSLSSTFDCYSEPQVRLTLSPEHPTREASPPSPSPNRDASPRVAMPTH